MNESCITLCDGSKIDLINPVEEMISIQTIAHGLSRVSRFGAQSPQDYSVAEHSLGMVQMAMFDGISDRDVLFALLMHDASEAYLGDIVSPLKKHLKEYLDIESRMNSVIEKKFNLDFQVHNAIIKKYDRKILKVEKKVLWGTKSSEKLFFSKNAKEEFLQAFDILTSETF
jgi:5'-deoxynucleotidase YfbR-like HD superfamily hydrolase